VLWGFPTGPSNQRRPRLAGGRWELTSPCGCTTWGTQGHDAAAALAWSVPAGNSGELQHVVLPSPTFEPGAAPLPATYSPQHGPARRRAAGGWCQAPPHCRQHPPGSPPRPRPAPRPWVQTPLCPSSPAAPPGLCPPPAPQPRQTSAAPPCPPAPLCPVTPTEGLGVASPLIYHLSGGTVKEKKSINKTT